VTRTDPAPTKSASRNVLDRFFSISERGSTPGRELRGGLVTFVTMVYIVVLNPIIIGTAKDANGNFLGAGDKLPDLAAVAAVTALVAAFFTILMGVVGRYPFALATGLGLNAFVAFQVASKMSWPDAMGMVVIEGLVITALVLTGFRTAVFVAIPRELKSAIAVGIGLFIALIGFVDAGFVRPGTGTPVQLGATGNLRGWPTLVFVIGVLLIAVLMARRVRGALLIGIAVATVLAMITEAIADLGPQVVNGKVVNPSAWALNVPSFDGKHFGWPDLHLVGNFSLGGGFDAVGVISAVVIIFSLVLSDFFDVMGTTIGLGSEAGALDEDGNLPNIGPVLLVDGLAAVGGGAASASSATTYVESASGIGDGARTGLSSVTTGVLFILTIFLAPIAQIVPSEAAAAALVVVGVLLMGQIRYIDFSDLTIAVPAFLTMVLMPFTYSITNGVGAGFISYVVLKAATGKARQVHVLMWIVAAVFAVYFAIEPLKTLFGVD
jgi:AGZA family xanthine/uracil permease-like MFS transporter